MGTTPNCAGRISDRGESMTNRKLAGRYAQALFASLSELRAAEQAEQFLTALAEAMTRSEELRDALLNPAFSQATRKAVLFDIAQGQAMPREIRNFLHAVVEHGRVEALPEIAQVFREVREQASGTVPATLTTASALSPDLHTRAQEALERLTGLKVRLSFDVEPEMLGGAIARIGSTVYDGSLRTQLSELRRRMAEE